MKTLGQFANWQAQAQCSVQARDMANLSSQERQVSHLNDLAGVQQYHFQPAWPTAEEVHQAMQDAKHDAEPFRQARAALAFIKGKVGR